MQRDGLVERTTISSRTSENSWCMGMCAERPIVRKIAERIANVTTVPVVNHEYFQVLRYHAGQFYRPHHDLIEDQGHMPCGPRVLTLFIFLSSLEDEHGGQTRFPELGISVSPQKGGALLWPNVLADDLGQMDRRTLHEALAPREGAVKYAINAWLHLYDFRRPHAIGCTG